MFIQVQMELNFYLFVYFISGAERGRERQSERQEREGEKEGEREGEREKSPVC